MKFRPENTLAHFNAAYQVRQHDLSPLPVAVFAKSATEYRKDCGQLSPSDLAVTFYTLNHCASIVRKAFTPNEPLPAWAQQIMATYTDVTLSQGERMLHYILAICTREMRHLHSYGKNSQKYAKIEQAGGSVMKKFIEHIQGLNDSASLTDAHSAVNYFMAHPPAATVGEYIKAMSSGFHDGGWEDSNGHTSYGGHKWGQVADAAAAMLTGATSMEMLVDTGYTLAHNGGPIFNKQMMYSGNGSHLLTILDVQRAGELADLMLATETLGVHKTPEALDAVTLIQQEFPMALKGYVDWKKVDACRPDKHTHPSKYAKVVGKAATAAAKAAAKATPAAPVMTTLLGKKVKVTGEWLVYPNQTVNVVERVKD